MPEQKMVKNVKVKVYLTPRQKQILEKLCQTLGTNESEALRLSLVNYAEKLNLLKNHARADDQKVTKKHIERVVLSLNK